MDTMYINRQLRPSEEKIFIERFAGLVNRGPNGSPATVKYSMGENDWATLAFYDSNVSAGIRGSYVVVLGHHVMVDGADVEVVTFYHFYPCDVTMFTVKTTKWEFLEADDILMEFLEDYCDYGEV